MKLGNKKAWLAGIGAAAAVTLLGGVGAYAAGELGWYSGGNATVPDPDNAATLTFYNASGTAITTGNTGAPFAAFAASSAALRAGDEFATLFAYTPSASTAQGAWTGSQLSATTKFAGDGKVSPVGSVPTDKPFAKGAANHESLAEYIGANPNTASTASLQGLYEIRLRTSSAAKGVGAAYASAFVKVTGSTWTKVAPPVLGGTTGETAVLLGERDLKYGVASTIPATVEGTGSAIPVGKLHLFNGTTKIAAVDLDAAGKAEVPITAKYFKPGTYTLTGKFKPTNTADFKASKASKAYTVAKGDVTVTQTVTRPPTSIANGVATAEVARGAGLPVPTGTVQVEVRQVGSDTVTTKGPWTLDTTGKAKVKLLKKPVGESWEYRTKYSGNSKYAANYSAWQAFTIAS